MASAITEAKAERVFVIGDIHGCAKEPEILLRHLEQNEAVSEKDLVVFLGDYIDRGPDSKVVIDLMLEFRSRYPQTRFLKGNHEDMMLDFLGFGGNLGQAFLYNGGVETIESYGMSVFSPPDEMVSALPPAHFKFLTELESVLVVGEFICVHAGLNPTRELNAQSDNDVFWIRDEFLSNTHAFNSTIIFGHTPHQELFVHLPYKVGIDTGLVFGNKLSCLELYSGKVLEVAKGTKEVIERTLDMSGRVFE